MESNVPNLDAMDVDELRAFWTRYQYGWPERRAELFPGRTRGAKKATQELARYAGDKLVATQGRLHGCIPMALLYEGICERTYAGLPEWARW